VAGELQIGGAPAAVLTATDLPAEGPAFTSATVLPGRGMMLLQARLRLPDGREVDALFAPPADEAARELDGGPDDFNGDKSFSFGGAILAPFANRIRGRPVEPRQIEAVVDGHQVRLPRNWGGKAPGAEQYAMHGLILDACVDVEATSPGIVKGTLAAGDFGGRWPGRAELGFEWRLEAGALRLRVSVRNVGDAVLPFGIGWHPYFALPSGDRRQARLRLPARRRAGVNNYDEVLPTGRLLPTAGTAYDFSAARELGELYLDDCFTDLVREDGQVVVEVLDPARNIGLRIATPSPEVKAVQVYAPPDKPFVVVEPQYNLADPYGAVWPAGTDTGMARLQPAQSLTYDVSVTAFALGTPARSGG
jgi:galactose mutarotase-like enzyme